MSSQDPDEPGIEGVDVVITDSDNMTITLTTDENGEYSEVVAAGTAVIDIVESTVPAGAIRTAGTDPTTVEVPVGGTGTDVDGFQLPVGKIEGTIFQDEDGDGAKDPGEPGIVGVAVVITDSNNETFTLTTDENGIYAADDVPAGPAEVDIDESSLPPGANRTLGTDPTTVEVPVNGTATDLDGFELIGGKIEGTVFSDVNGNELAGS